MLVPNCSDSEILNILSYPYIKSDLVSYLNVCIFFQSCSMAFDEVNENTVYTCVGHPLRKDIENIVYWVLNENFTTAYNSILCV